MIKTDKEVTGERNGITPLGALMARMVVTAPEYTKSKYKLKELKALETLVADAVQINIPFNNPITYVTCCVPARDPVLTDMTQWLLCLHPQGRHSRQGHSQQPFGKTSCAKTRHNVSLFVD
jgi:hypothetical protein